MAEKDEAVVVVASQKGSYGSKPRYPGERFAIKSRQAFSTRWMIDAKDASRASDIKRLEREYAVSHGPRSQDVTDDQLLAEIAQSSGAAAVLRAENIKLKERIRALEEQIAKAGEPAGPADAASAEEVVEAGPDGSPGEADSGDGDGEAAAKNDVSRATPGRTPRRTRRAS